MRYTRKPLEVQAFQWAGSDQALPEWLIPFMESKAVWFSLSDTLDPVMFIAHPNGVYTVNVGDYVVLKGGGELLANPAYKFELEYEAVMETPPAPEPPPEEPPAPEQQPADPPVEG